MKTVKVFMLVIFFSILIFMNLSVFADNGNQLPDTDKLEEAILIKPGTYTGNLGEKEEEGQMDNDDYYSIEVEEGQLITLQLTIPGNANYQIYLLNTNRNSRGSAIAQKESKILDYVADSTGTWYIRIRRSSGEGEYRLSIDIQNQDDAASGQDAGKSVQEAIPLSLGTITGFLKKGDNDDYYSIEVEEGQLITLQLTIPGNANYQIYLLNTNRNSRGSAIAQKESKILDYVADSTGTWYIRIRRSSGEGEYRLSIDIQNQDDAASGQDAGKSVQEAIPLSLGTITGFLKKGDNEDCYSIEVEEGQLITLQLTIPGNANYQIYLLNTNRNSRGSAITQKESKILDYVADSTGTWYIRIHRSSGEGEYQLSLNISVGQADEETGTSVEERDIVKKDGKSTSEQGPTEETLESHENQPPVASFEFPPIAMAEVDVLFDAGLSYDPDGEITYYEWIFKEKDEILYTENKEKVIYQFDTPGMYEVVLCVTDDEGAKNIAIYTIEIVPKTDQPVARFTYVSIGSIEENNFSFDGSSSYGPGTITVYEWDFGDGSTTELGKQVNHNFPEPGIYQVTLTVIDQHGEYNRKAQTIDTTILPLTASFTISPRDAGVSETVNFDAFSSHGPRPIETYEWDFGDDSEEGYGIDVNHTFTAPGTYTVQLTIIDDFGVTSTQSDTITVFAIDDKSFIQCGTIQAGSGDWIPFRAPFPEQPIVLTSAVVDGSSVVVSSPSSPDDITNTRFKITINDLQGNPVSSALVHWIAFVPDPNVRCLGGFSEVLGADSERIIFDPPIDLSVNENIVVLTNAVRNVAYTSRATHIVNGFQLHVVDDQGSAVHAFTYWMAVVPCDDNDFQGRVETLNNGAIVPFDPAFINPSVCVCCSSTPGVVAGAVSSSPNQFTLGLSADAVQAELNWLAYGGGVPSLQPGQINVGSTPAGAEVYLDGSYIDITPVGSFLEIPNLMPGRYTVKLQLQDYNDYEGTVTVSPSEIKLIDRILHITPGTIMVSSVPPGATIMVDESSNYPFYWDIEQGYVNPLYGTTLADPVELRPIPPGDHTLTLSLADFETWSSETYHLDPGGTWTVNAILIPEPGTITVTSDPPGATVYLTSTPDVQDSWEEMGVTLGSLDPLVLNNIPPGTYTIKCCLDYYDDKLIDNEVESNYTTDFNLDLTRARGVIRVTAQDELGDPLYYACPIFTPLSFTPAYEACEDCGETDTYGISEGYINAGTYTLTVMKQYYNDGVVDNIEVTADCTPQSPLEVNATLVAHPGSICVSSNSDLSELRAYLYPGNVMDIPDNEVDWGLPVDLNSVERGNYTLKLLLPGYISGDYDPLSGITIPDEGYPFKTTVNVDPGSPSSVIADFTQMTGTIEVTSNEGDAEVFIDDLSKGSLTNMEVGVYSIPTGTHTVLVIKDNFTPYQTNVVVDYQDTVTVQANLYQPLQLTAFINATPLYGNPGLEVNFTGTGAGPEGTTIDGYVWDFGDDTSSQAQNPPPHLYSNVGYYNVSLTVTDIEGNTSSPNYVCIRVRNQNIVEPALDCLTILYDGTVDPPINGEITYLGNILINGFLEVDSPGTVTVNDDGEVTVNGNLITGNDAIDDVLAFISGGNFTIGEKDFDVGGCYRSIGSTSSNFSLYGLGFSMSDLKLYENRLSISAEISPSWLPLADVVKVTISVSSEGLNFGGGIELPEFTIAGFGVKDAFLNLDLGCEGGNCWESGITFKLPPAVGIDPGGSLGIQNGNLNKVSVKVGGFTPPVPIGNTGVFLESLDGGLENIPPDPNPLVFHAGAGFYAGPKIPPTGEIPPFNLLGVDFGGSYHLLGGDVNLTVDCGGSFTAEGDAYVLANHIGPIGNAGLTINFNKGLYLWGGLEYPPGVSMLVGDIAGKLDWSAEFQASVSGYLQAPDFLPIIGGTHFGQAVGYIDNDLIAAGVSIGDRVCAFGHCVDLSVPACLMFQFNPPELSVASNWDAIQEVDLTSTPLFFQASRIEGPLVYAGLGMPPLGQSHTSYAISSTARANPTVERVLPEGLEVAIFYMKMLSEGISPNFMVTTPGGVEYDERSTEVIWRRNDAAGDLWCAVPNPKAGRWTVTPDDSLRGSEYKIAIYQLNEKPTLGITSPKEDVFVEAGMNIPIIWEAEDSDDEAMIRLCYSDSQLQLGKSNLPTWPGNTIVKNLSEENLKSSPYNWNTTGVAPGKYYIYGVITDGKNFPVFAWSEGSVTVQRKDFKPPKSVNADPDGSLVRVKWDSVPGATGYRVYYQNVNKNDPLSVAVSQAVWEDMAKKAKCLLEEERPSDISQAVWEYMIIKSERLLEEGPIAISKAVWGDKNTELRHLKHGVTYRIAVTAFNDEGLESDYSEFIEVTY